MRELEQIVRKERYSLTDLRLRMPTTILKLYKIRVITTPNIEKGGFMPSFKVFCKFTEFYNSLDHVAPKFISDRPHSDHTPVFKIHDEEERKVMDVDSDDKKRKSRRKKYKMDLEDQSSSSSDDEDKAAGVEFDPKNQVLLYDDIKI